MKWINCFLVVYASLFVCFLSTMLFVCIITRTENGDLYTSRDSMRRQNLVSFSTRLIGI
jgi:hypothetical protein